MRFAYHHRIYILCLLFFVLNLTLTYRQYALACWKTIKIVYDEVYRNASCDLVVLLKYIGLYYSNTL